MRYDPPTQEQIEDAEKITEIELLIKRLDMGEPDPSDYIVAKHLFEAQDRHRVAMAKIKLLLVCIPAFKAKIASLQTENARIKAEVERKDKALNYALEMSLTHSGDPYVVIGRLGEIAEQALAPEQPEQEPQKEIGG